MRKKKAIKALLALLFLILTVSGALAAEKKTVENSIGMTFVYIKSGTFMMGSPADEPGRFKDETQHQVTLTRGFYMQTTEVTQGQWQSVAESNPSYFKKCGYDCPVERVSWNDVQEFIKRLNQKEGGNRYRLSTEAEWEYAARAGTTTPFNTGNCLSTDQANYEGLAPDAGCSKGEYRQTTVRTGSFSPNAWGLYDMHGNVEELCQDWYDWKSYPSGSVIDPAGPLLGSLRVYRGGSWQGRARRGYDGYCRSADRDGIAPSVRSWSSLGFRLVMTP